MRRLPLACALLLLAGCGGRERETPPADPFVAVEPTAVLPEEDLHRAAPRWERITELSGSGPATHRLAIPGRTIQWRVRWRCEFSGELAMTLAPGGRLLDEDCPGRGDATAVRGGRLDLRVQAAGRWSAVVEQQVDSPLAEPPLPEMTPGRVVARGRMRPVERRGEGEVTLYRLPGGRLALRLERGFETSASSDLELWVKPGRRPRTSRAALRGEHVRVRYLKATAGSQNYLLPPRLRARDVRSLVLWCEPLYMAYASAGLAPA